ncbi:MAG: hypothetical protein AMS26_17580 [Bacteroides sp. SM23_62]|nr:MAG: hypothetical protein AMS26_17580 [Bacteroides sp. SM23_62]
MKKWVLGIWLFHLVGGFLFAQGEIKQQARIFYRNEKSLGISLNSNGMGISGRYAKRLNARKKTIWEIDGANIKHPKEVRISNYYYNNRSFVFGKQNLFLNLRGGWGKQHEMFRKVDRGGISIRRYFTVGPAIGFLKPIYYEVFKAGGGGVNDYYISEEKFDPSIHLGYIYGRASFFKGFNEIAVVPGVYGRFGLSFEYSKSDITIHAIETGVSLDLFPKKIEIMATEQNNFYFLTLFVAYRFGKVVDAKGIVDEGDLY